MKQKKLKNIRKELNNSLEEIIENTELIKDFIECKEEWIDSDEDKLMLEITKLRTGEYLKLRQEQLYAGLIVEAMATIENGLIMYHKQLNESNKELKFESPTQIIAKIKKKTGVEMDRKNFSKLRSFIESRNKLVHDSFKIGILEPDKSKQFEYLNSYLSDSQTIIDDYLKKVCKKIKKTVT